MTAQDKTFHDFMKKTIFTAIVTYGLVFITSFAAFYYTTRTTQEHQSEQIKNIDSKLDELIMLHVQKSCYLNSFLYRPSGLDMSGKVK